MKFILLGLWAISATTAAATAAEVHHDFIPNFPGLDKVEYFWAYPEGEGPFPLLLLIHPEQSSPKPGGNSFVESGQIDFWVKKGFVAVAISQPGYGASEGPADFCGTRTQNAVVNLLKNFVSKKELVSKRVYLYGGSRGAVVASKVATLFPELRGVVLKSGVYNFDEWFKRRPWYDPIKLAMLWEIGWPSSDKLRERSAYFEADKIKVPVLIIHGTKDTRAPMAIAEQFSDAIARAGGTVELKKIESEHVIPMDEIGDLMDQFFRKHR